MYLSAPPSRSVTQTVTRSAHLLGNRVQRVQDVHGQVACRLLPELGVSLDRVRDQFKTSDVGRLQNCWRSHEVSFFRRACPLGTELPDTHDGTPFPTTGRAYGHV